MLLLRIFPVYIEVYICIVIKINDDLKEKRSMEWKTKIILLIRYES